MDSYILTLSCPDRLGIETARGVLLPVELTRQEIADMVGTSVETAIRILSRWAKEGIVASTADGILIRQRDALEEIGNQSL